MIFRTDYGIFKRNEVCIAANKRRNDFHEGRFLFNFLPLLRPPVFTIIVRLKYSREYIEKLEHLQTLVTVCSDLSREL